MVYLTLIDKIIKHLIENKDKTCTIRQISLALKTDYKNTFMAIGEIASCLEIQKIGNSNLIKIKLKPAQEIFSVERKRTDIFLEKNKKLELVKRDIENMGYPFFIAAFFGSSVKGTGTRLSDVDLCIIGDNKERVKELNSRLELLPINLEIHQFSVGEFESMLKVKALNIAKEIIKSNIIIYGLESYYNLVERWMKKE